ncbi:hypothetical protein HQN89_35575 [Paenibacillus frigoriresistens]|uniref:hypothetical protein n=1 Tax=Paenibacillus alginolyticus TaxID=59839 RepID=UPI001563DDCB|nr:hypothetical protein [Paenibacillus frigoriresistens]NRF96119.1 hypothetical protein [Paenibacillus frigoriresistens]
MIEKYSLLKEPDKTMFVFEKNGMYYGHIVKNKTEKSVAKLLFETAKYDSVEQLKSEYPAQEI